MEITSAPSSNEEAFAASFFVDVILPLPIPKHFTYQIPLEIQDQVQIGCRVIVPFGKRKVLTAIVSRLNVPSPTQYQAKFILELLDDIPMTTPAQIRLFEWIAEYYLCHVGEVMNVALPSGLKISSQSKIQLRPQVELEHKLLSEKEYKLIQALQETHSLSYDEAAKIIEVRNIFHIIKSLIDKEVILVFEEIKERYQPKTVKKIRLTQDYLTKPALEKLSKKLEKSPKQLNIVLLYLRHVPVFRDWTINELGLEKKLIRQQEHLSPSSLKTLIKNQVFEEFDEIVSRFEGPDASEDSLRQIDLSPAQAKAQEEIMKLFESQRVVLLHGVTGSGKTEIYINLIQQVLASGSQVLYLLPEIALTTQIVSRLRKVFGNSMGVYHSKFSDNERVETWQGVISGRFSFVVGVRSSIFLPFDNLGLIIVDEEHEPSYKQHEPAPRYHARDLAIVIAQQQHCKVLLGSATPAIESFYHAKKGKYGLVQLSERFGNAQLPHIEMADLAKERRDKTIKGHFSSYLLKEMETRLKNEEQIILFQNRRGYSPYMTCKECQWIPKCTNCDVSLTYHMSSNELRCHYCGHQEAPPRTCPTCASTRIETVGLGTEKIEDDLKILLPEARVQRMDLDTTRSKDAYQKILESFEQHQIDILVGTQMISKGLDFDRVGLVGIFDADRLINFPDFRSYERAYQILTQVSGRAGRKNQKGRVIIQTSDTQQPLLAQVIRNDYDAMYLSQIDDRAFFLYPPFTRLILLVIKHPERQTSKQAAENLSLRLVEKLGRARVLGPEPPIINRIRNKYLHHILIKIEREKVDLKLVKSFISYQVEEVITQQVYKKVQVVIDVDPI